MNITNKYYLDILIAVLKQDNDSIRSLLNDFAPQLIEIAKNNKIEVSVKQSIEIKNFLLSMQVFIQGSDIHIDNLIRKSLKGVDPNPAKLLYLASKGNLKCLENIVEDLGFSNNKGIILEYVSLLTNNISSLKEIGNKLGVYEENIEMFEDLCLFIMTVTKYKSQIKPKILSELKGVMDIKKEIKARFLEVINPIKDSLNNSILSFVRGGAVDARPAKKKNVASSIVSGASKIIKKAYFEKQIFSVNVNSVLSPDEIHEFCERKVNEIINEDNTTEDILTKEIVGYFEFNKNQFKLFKNIIAIASAFMLDVTTKEIKQDQKLQTAFKITCLFLEIGEEHLDLFLDIVSQNPFRIFKCLTPNPKINTDTMDIFGEFDTSRLEMISDLIGYSRKELRQVIAIWINNFSFLSNSKYISETLEFCKQELKIDPSLFELMYNKKFNSGREYEIQQIEDSIKSFISKSLYNLQNNINDDIQSSNFELLRTENIPENIKMEIAKLDTVDSTNEIIDSPFSQSNGRSSKDIKDFLKYIRCLIKLKEGGVEMNKILKKLFPSCSKLLILNLFNKCIVSNSIDFHLLLLEEISKIEIELEDIQQEEYAYKLEEWGDSRNELASINLTNKDKSQWMIFQLTFLFCCNKLNEMLMKVSLLNKKKMSKAIDDFFININKFIPEEQKLLPSQIGLDDTIISIFETSFFSDIAKRLFYQTIPETQAISCPEVILGMIVGLSLMNTNLVRTSLLKLLGQTKSKDISGLFAILSKDPNLEKDIRAICKSLKIKPDLTLNLIDLLCTDKERDRYNPILNICGDYCSSANVVSTLVSIFKGDLTVVRRLAVTFEVDYHMLSIVLACACKRIDLFQESYNEISTKLKIKNERAVEIVLEIACGNIDKVLELENEECFRKINISELVEILRLSNNGVKMRQPHKRFEIPDQSNGCRIITDKLKEAFGINVNLELSDNNLNNLDDMNDIICLLVGAVWGCPDNIFYITEKIEELIDQNNNSLSKIWSKFPQFKSTIITQSFEKIFKSAENTIFGQTSEIKKNLSKNMEYLDALQTNKNIKINFEDDNEDIIKSFKDIRKQLAYKIGCTTNIAGNKELNQKFMECLTCFTTTNTIVKVCLCCAEFCHARHELKAPKESEQNIICSCGSNLFPNCPVNDKGNPLERIEEINNLPPTSCSLLKEVQKEIMNNKNNFKISSRLLNNNSKIINKYSKISKDNNSKEECKDCPKLSCVSSSDDEETKSRSYSDKAKYYDEIELKEKFEEEMERYDPQEFIIDLILILKFECSEAKENSPTLYKNCFYTYDESLCRYVHFYEHIILLAQGICRPGLIRLLTCDGPLEKLNLPNSDKDNTKYSTFMSIVSLVQGDYENFLRNCVKFLKNLNIKRGSGSTILQKGARLMMMVYSFNHYTEINEISGVRDEYRRIFMEIFPKKYKTVMPMHKLTCIREDCL